MAGIGLGKMNSKLTNFAIVGALAASALISASPASAEAPATHGAWLVAAAECAKQGAGDACMGDEAEAISELALRWLSSRDGERVWDRPTHAGTVKKAVRNERRTLNRRELCQARNREAAPFPATFELA